jgi:hypothetical protein
MSYFLSDLFPDDIILFVYSGLPFPDSGERVVAKPVSHTFGKHPTHRYMLMNATPISHPDDDPLQPAERLCLFNISEDAEHPSTRAALEKI